MGFMVSRGVQSVVRSSLCVVHCAQFVARNCMSEYPDSRLCLPVFVCFRLFLPVPAGHDGPAGYQGVVEDARGGSSGATPPAQEVCRAIL